LSEIYREINASVSADAVELSREIRCESIDGPIRQNFPTAHNYQKPNSKYTHPSNLATLRTRHFLPIPLELDVHSGIIIINKAKSAAWLAQKKSQRTSEGHDFPFD